MTLRNRIEKLEASNNGAATAVIEQEPLWGDNEITRKLLAALGELHESLTDEHKLIFDSDLDALYLWFYGAAGDSRSAFPALSKLTLAAARLLIDVLAGHYRGPVIMPPAVAEGYINSVSSFAHYRCADCYYPSPHTSGPNSRPVIESCPACNGKIEQNGGRGNAGLLTGAEIEAGLAFLCAIERTQKILHSMGEQYRGEVEAWLYERDEATRSPLIEMFLDVQQPEGFNGDYYLVPAELPPNACELFKMNEAEWGNFNAGYSENCEDCGYPAPTLHVAPKRDNETKGAIETKVIRLWESCIICGGVTGWRAYQIKHKHQGYAHLTPYGERAKDEPEKPS